MNSLRRAAKQLTYLMVWIEGMIMGVHMMSVSIWDTPVVQSAVSSPTHQVVLGLLGALTAVGALWIAIDFLRNFERVDID